MTLRVVFRRAARQDYEDAMLWYEAQRPGLGVELRIEVDRAMAMAAEEPRRFPRMHKEARCVRVRRFPYSVYFLAEAQRLVVVSVFHARRDPLVWRSRA
jgi:plasmid stabilization system protein ParE